MAFQYLLLLDTDKIKDYVFASSRLKEIRGASMLLEHLNTSETERVIKDYFKSGAENEKFRIIYLDGGSGKVEFADEKDAIACGKQIEQLYREQTNSAASISWEVVQINEQAYYQSVSQGEFKLRLKKQKGKNLGQLNHMGIIHRCSNSGYDMVENIEQQFYAVPGVEHTYKKLTELTDSPDEKKFAKVSPASVIKQAFYKEHISRATGLTKMIEESYSGSFEWPKQLAVIGKAAKNGDIGLLYFDGNSMNKVLKKLKTAEDYKKFSNGLKASIQESLIDTILDLFPEETLPVLVNSDEEAASSQEVKVLPLQLILTAGDDIIIVVPSTKAMEFAGSFLEKFSEKAKAIDPDGDGLTMSAGVAIAKASFPIKYLVPLAEQLLRSAKKKNYELKQEGVTDSAKLSTIDYMAVSMSSNPDLTAIRNEELRRKEGNVDYMLTKRPYTLSQWQQIQSIVQSMKKHKFPGSKIKSFYHLHFMEEWEGAYYYGKYYGNLSESLREDLKELYQAVYGEQLAENFNFWVKEDNRFESSPLLDVFEIYRYVEGGNLQWQESTLVTK